MRCSSYEAVVMLHRVSVDKYLRLVMEKGEWMQWGLWVQAAQAGTGPAIFQRSDFDWAASSWSLSFLSIRIGE